jgi:hypothetical protein
VTVGTTRRRVSRKTASATLLATSLLATSLLPILLTARSATATTDVTTVDTITTAAAPAAPLTVFLTAISPTVAVPQAPVTITGTARNNGLVAIALPVARAFLGQSPLTSRDAVADWADGAGQQPLAEVARAPLGKTLAPGAATTFALTVPAAAIIHQDSFAVLPLRVEVAGRSADGKAIGDLHTFLPTLSRIKRYEPMSVAWLVPLTLDPDPALHGTDSPARTAAWVKAIGPGSRLDKLIQGTQGAAVTWAIDPAILGPLQTSPAAGPSVGATPSPGISKPPTAGTTVAPDPVTAATTALTQRLKAAAPLHTLWSLPYADPDLSAILPIASGSPVLPSLITRPSSLNATVGPARTDIAWPVDGTLTPRSEARLRRAFTSPGLSAAVTSESTLPDRSGSATGASRKSSSGLPLLAYDEALSRTVAQTSSRTSGAQTIQRFLADSMALLGERPGTQNRSVLIAEPRMFAGDPTVLRSLFAAVANAPWLKTTTTEKLLAASRKAEREAPGLARTAKPSSPAASRSASGRATSASPLTAGDLAAMPGTIDAIAGVGSILVDKTPFVARWTDAQIQMLSARWRGHPGGVPAIDAATRAAISGISRSVRVAPSSVNFFADRGVMQVTVVNDLSVPIHNVRLTLSPGQPRLRIEQQPGLLKIGAKSRANVKVQVTSIAAGLVRIEADLTTPNATPLGENASVAVRVQPPSPWIYWALGGLAGLVLVLGTYRSLRRGSTRGSRPDAQELPLNDRVLDD